MMEEAKENDPQECGPAKRGVKRRAAFNAPAFKKPAMAAANAGKPALARSTTATARPAAAAPPAAAAAASSEVRYFTVLYCKYQPSKKQRKNKSFADGILSIGLDSKRAALLDIEGKQVSASVLRGVNVATMGTGSTLVVGNWEVEVEEAADGDKFKSGELFLKPTAAAMLAAAPVAAFHKPAAGGVGGGFKRPGMAGSGASSAAAAAAAAAAAKPEPARWLHDPHADNALVLNAQQWAGGSGTLSRGTPVVPVVVDSYLARHLRPHQVEGLRFLYEATMGLRSPGMSGGILADEMGLGKTLQVLALVWTLLKQGPQGRPVVRKVAVVTPSSLTQNWADEARKWLGDERMRVMVLSPGPQGKQQVVDFKHGSVYRAVAVSYETLRKHAAELAGCVDLLVCDEGHRLKSAQGNKTISALTSLNCPRRVLLTGTPLQNNLSEFYAMVNFVNPDSLGSLATFERVLAAPINRSRDRNASAEERELGATRSAELSRRVEAFVLRRTREVNARYLPPLSDYVVFCRPTEAQLRLYRSVLGSSSVRSLLSASGNNYGDQTLTVLTNLRKICNHPSLYTPTPTDGGGEAAAHEAAVAAEAAPEAGAGQGLSFDAEQSGKMAVLGLLLRESLVGAGERVVVVSQSTAALDLVQKLCDGRGWKTVRIDGGTDVAKRQDVVNSFNLYGVGQVFLLSTTAGGAGLNLTGANRLVLLDSHWNPAMDLQAMARVWRDGQKKACVVYRLLTTGTLDEKMYQRQLKKGDLAATTMGGAGGGGGTSGGEAAKKAGGKFSKEELKQLFTLRTDTCCDTADLLSQAAAAAQRSLQRAGCVGGGSGDQEGAGTAASASAAASEFRNVAASCTDVPLSAAIQAGHVTFVHLEPAQLAVAAAAASAQPVAGEAGIAGEAAAEPAAAGGEDADSLDVEEEEEGL
ncbi:hypothetical protein D9Q98_002784 [Chlorella vulgaris]|uniref:Uncharacterized protein n=1 Tax=Chlorella vulgaris TaxID=3077 RepID=A0A9D4YZG0_CHLVU|nr:hypothetical protein D9Q98_002784 [Chlorella vulgaris]